MPKTKKQLIEDDIKKYAKLEAVASTEGGRDLISYLQSGVGACVIELCSKYKTSELKDLLPIIARMDEKLNLLQALTRAAKNKDLAIEALKELEKLGEET